MVVEAIVPTELLQRKALRQEWDDRAQQYTRPCGIPKAVWHSQGHFPQQMGRLRRLAAPPAAT